jgi:N-acetylglucosamine kinase-like BadF-type ATPase
LVAAGTGIVGLGIGPTGAARVDGTGSMIGDDGSGWWIGRRGAIAALSAHDGRSGGSPRLLSFLERQFGPVADFPAVVAASKFPVGTVASFAPAVAAAAREGDVEAGVIWAEAARHIGDAVVASAIRAGFERDARFPWAVTGRLTGAADLLDPVMESLISARFPAAFRVNSGGSSLDGAERLLQYPDANTLAPLVGTSTKERESSEEKDIHD